MIVMPRHLIEERNRKGALENAQAFRHIALFALSVAEAIEEDDSVCGPVAAEGFMAALTSLPGDLRDDITAAVSDEAARSLRADRLYIEDLA